jgi:hypothetical protein
MTAVVCLLQMFRQLPELDEQLPYILPILWLGDDPTASTPHRVTIQALTIHTTGKVMCSGRSVSKWNRDAHAMRGRLA